MEGDRKESDALLEYAYGKHQENVKHESSNEAETSTSGSKKKSGSCCSTLWSTGYLLYYSHTLSSWGDRMWQFATGMFLVALSPDSLRLTAIYGFTSGGAILLFGAIIGDWVDKKPRLRVVQISLIVANVSVTLSALFVCVAVYWQEDLQAIWSGWLETLVHMAIIVFAVIGDVYGVGRQIAIERDWICVICEGDTESLTEMSAFLRRIYLCCKTIAPIATGQIMTFGSTLVGAMFIAGWNIVSVFVEYALLLAIYKSVPSLAIKAVDKEKEVSEKTPLLGNDKVATDYGFIEGSTEAKKNSNGFVLNVDENGGKIADGSDEGEGRNPALNCCMLMFDGIIILVKGWKVYMKQPCLLAGLGLAALFMTALGFDNITTGYAYAQGLSESTVGIAMGLGAFLGILGTVAFPWLRKRIGLERTGLFGFTFQFACIILCIVSVFSPGSPFDPSFLFEDHNEPAVQDCEVPSNAVSMNLYTNDFSPLYHPMSRQHVQQLVGPIRSVDSGSRDLHMAVLNDTSYPHILPENCTSTTPPTGVPTSYVSIILLLSGIVFSRFGLWISDLTVTQLLIETPPETERGTVNGVQNSLNFMMDLFKFALVIVLPWPETFGILVLLSCAFVGIGGLLYACYSRKARGHLFHFDKYEQDIKSRRYMDPETRLLVPLDPI